MPTIHGSANSIELRPTARPSPGPSPTNFAEEGRIRSRFDRCGAPPAPPAQTAGEGRGRVRLTIPHPSPRPSPTLRERCDLDRRQLAPSGTVAGRA